MGLFSSKKIVSVASTLYNMAGDEDDRPDFLKGTVFGAVISNSPSLADSITGSYFSGPGQQQLQFFRYAQQVNYSVMPTTSITNSASVDASVVAGEITPTSVPPAPAGLTLHAYNAEITDGDFEMWLEKWILANHPTRINEDWLGEYNPTTDTFSVEFPNNDFFSWLNDGTYGPVYDVEKEYIVAKYVEYSDSSEREVVEGTPTTGVTTLPDVTGWTVVQDESTSTTVTLSRSRTTIWSYDNGDPDVTHEDAVNADVSGSLNTSEDIYKQETVITNNGLEIIGEREIWNFTATDTVTNTYSNTVVTTTTLGDGTVRTETSTTTGEEVLEQWTTRYDTQDLFIGSQYGIEQVFIYEIGTGNATLDALVADIDSSSFQEFFPFVPIRIDNNSIEEPGYSALFEESAAIYRKAFQGKRFGDLVETVEDNPDLGDIDYAYLCWGTSLNSKDNAAKLYMYDFFKQVIPFQNAGSGNAMTEWIADIQVYNNALDALEAWELANGGSEGGNWNSIGPRPELPPTPSLPPTNTIRLTDSTIDIDYRVKWIHIEETQFTGTFEVVPTVQSKIKDCKLEIGPSTSYDQRYTFSTESSEITRTYTITIPSMYIYRQIDETTYRRLQIWGLISQNYIYKGKSVDITSTDALNDSDESGFFIPLHYPTMKDMNIIDYTQLCTANSHILFNSYEVTKQKWYEKGIFKILLVIAVIVVAVIAFPAAFAGGAGLLGTNLAVGAALGLTGTAALVAGVISNYIASIIVAEVLKIVGTELLGEKWGALFAAIASLAMSMTISGVSLFSTEGLLGLGNSIANGYAGWVEGDIAEMQEDFSEDENEYEERMEYIQNLIDSLDGNNDLKFDPRFLTQGQRGNRLSDGYIMESSEQFIRRTTMTGADIVELTHSMVFDYVDIARTLPRNV